MLRTFVRVVLVAAVAVPVSACGKPAEPTALEPAPLPLLPDPEQEAKKAQEAAYRKCLEAGTKALAAGDLESGIAQLKLALAEKPDGAEAFLHLGRAYTAKKDDDAAVKQYTEAVHANGQLLDAYMERAALFERLNQLDDAIADYRQVIAIDTDRKTSARAYWLRGGLVDRQGNREEYREFREKAIKLDYAYQKQVTGGDLAIVNQTDALVTLRIDQLVKPDGTERPFPPDARFTVPPSRDDAPTYLTDKDQILSAKSVRLTVITKAGTRPLAATYKKGMSLELVITPNDVPR